MIRSRMYPVLSIQAMIALLFLVLLLPVLGGCGGGGDSGPANVGGGYTLVASGGTLNDGSGTKGLVLLATLRSDAGNGPAVPWEISVTGPGLGSPLRVTYDDGSPSSYMTWWWPGLDPGPGQYTATATDGTTTLIYSFTLTVDAAMLAQPALMRNGNTISWDAVPGAGSYYYRVTDGMGTDVISPGYFSTGQNAYSFDMGTLTEGSYLVEVYAMTTDRAVLGADVAAWPALASPENLSLGSKEFVQGGGYSLDARGGVLNQGFGDRSIVIWASIITASTDSTVSPTPPAGDWTITVTGPGISNTAPLAFSYPRTNAQYVFWDYAIMPSGSGTYTVTAVPAAGGYTLSTTFSILAPAQELPVASAAAQATSGGGANISWTAVTGANSYYVNIWTYVNGDYTEIAGNWMKSRSATVSPGTLTPGLEYDVYVTACALDMTDTTTAPPVAPGAQVNMSDTVYSYATIVGK